MTDYQVLTAISLVCCLVAMGLFSAEVLRPIAYIFLGIGGVFAIASVMAQLIGG